MSTDRAENLSDGHENHQIVRIALLASHSRHWRGRRGRSRARRGDERGGLVPLKTKDVDLAYTRPGATLAAYKKVMLDPIDVAFHKDWNPERAGSRLKLSAQERENIRSGVARSSRKSSCARSPRRTRTRS
jgi:hypothetical protein